ncbi:MAG: L,D-transpeptidase family protein [Desulfuromonadaceae bacterium]|nr:L,D-transpeptidase family protein [Desulfuromonadaceae bacterium]
MRLILIAAILSFLPALSYGSNLPEADLVVVYKSTRTMALIKDGLPFREYSISLGENPLGHKIKEGDKRTPEGEYLLDWRRDNDFYHRSIHISYPNEEDREAARERGVKPGGMIMIHGIPKIYERVADVLKERNWTSGCIAVSNDEMNEIWNLVRDGTPIRIIP